MSGFPRKQQGVLLFRGSGDIACRVTRKVAKIMSSCNLSQGTYSPAYYAELDVAK